MSDTTDPVVFDDDNPEWTEADFARAKPLGEASPALAETLARHRGAQKAPTKTPVTMRLDSDLVAALRATGRGWQGRVNERLRDAFGLDGKQRGKA